MHNSATKPIGVKLRQAGVLVAAAAACAFGGSAAAQTSFGSGVQLVIPLIANITSAYQSSVFVRNPNASPMTLNVKYYRSVNAAPPTGLRPCSQLNLQANQSVTFDLGTQCGLNSADDFGMLVLEDAALTSSFMAYSRTQLPDQMPDKGGNGFSVEGFPFDNFSGATSHVLGLQGAGVPNYRSNCFVSALDDPVNWQLQLVQSGTETVLGSTSGSLGAFETTRILDVFASLGVAADSQNVRATFSTTDAGPPAFVGFCTLETQVQGSADFRIAKSMTPPPAPPGPPPSTPTATWSGPMLTLNANQSTYIFMGPTASVTLAGTSTVTAYGTGSFERNTAGAVTISVGVCSWDQVAPGPTLMPAATSPSVSNSPVSVLAIGSASLPAGSYNVGLCAINNNGVAVNKNHETGGFVFVTP